MSDTMKLQSHTNIALLEQSDIPQVWTPKNVQTSKKIDHYMTGKNMSCNEATHTKAIV